MTKITLEYFQAIGRKGGKATARRRTPAQTFGRSRDTLRSHESRKRKAKAILSKNARDLSGRPGYRRPKEGSMKPRSTFAKDHLLEIYPDPVPWVREVFDPRIETLLESPDIDNRDRMMIRLRSQSIQDRGRCTPPVEISLSRDYPNFSTRSFWRKLQRRKTNERIQ